MYIYIYVYTVYYIYICVCLFILYTYTYYTFLIHIFIHYIYIYTYIHYIYIYIYSTGVSESWQPGVSWILGVSESEFLNRSCWIGESFWIVIYPIYRYCIKYTYSTYPYGGSTVVHPHDIPLTPPSKNRSTHPPSTPHPQHPPWDAGSVAHLGSWWKTIAKMAHLWLIYSLKMVMFHDFP